MELRSFVLSQRPKRGSGSVYQRLPLSWLNGAHVVQPLRTLTLGSRAEATTQDKISVDVVLAPRSEISSSMQWTPVRASSLEEVGRECNSRCPFHLRVGMMGAGRESTDGALKIEGSKLPRRM